MKISNAKAQRHEDMTGARPLGRFTARKAEHSKKLSPLSMVALKRHECRAPLRLCTFARLR